MAAVLITMTFLRVWIELWFSQWDSVSFIAASNPYHGRVHVFLHVTCWKILRTHESKWDTQNIQSFSMAHFPLVSWESIDTDVLGRNGRHFPNTGRIWAYLFSHFNNDYMELVKHKNNANTYCCICIHFLFFDKGWFYIIINRINYTYFS